RDPQAVHGDVVADVDDGGHLVAALAGHRPYAEEETRAADTAGQDHDSHPAILHHRPRNGPRPPVTPVTDTLDLRRRALTPLRKRPPKGLGLRAWGSWTTPRRAGRCTGRRRAARST